MDNTKQPLVKAGYCMVDDEAVEVEAMKRAAKKARKDKRNARLEERS